MAYRTCFSLNWFSFFFTLVIDLFPRFFNEIHSIFLTVFFRPYFWRFFASFINFLPIWRYLILIIFDGIPMLSFPSYFHHNISKFKKCQLFFIWSFACLLAFSHGLYIMAVCYMHHEVWPYLTRYNSPMWKKTSSNSSFSWSFGISSRKSFNAFAVYLVSLLSSSKENVDKINLVWTRLDEKCVD